MKLAQPSISFFGDGALLVRYAERIDPAINDRVHDLAERIRAQCASGAGWGPPVAAYASLLVPYDPLRVERAQAEAQLHRLLESTTEARAAADGRAPLEIPVRYGGADGPDLDEVARRTGLSAARVVELHARGTYRAYLLGFAPGFAYLGVLPEELRLPRRSSPRPVVPAGSVAIAGAQTAVYPLATPGGWHLLGRTDLPVWDPQRDPPALVQARRNVRFVPTGD